MVSDSVDLSVYNLFQAVTITLGIVMFLQLLKGMAGIDSYQMLMGYLGEVGKKVVASAFSAIAQMI